MKGLSFIAVILQLLSAVQVNGWNEGKVLLQDVQVLTLYRGRNTAARRAAPVKQLQCVGGSAGCFAFVPEVVQCQNRGWDGLDVQWECKTDMDSAYRFGTVEVSCEGFDHPDDPYVLKGSCGLEYTLELTKAGGGFSSSGWRGNSGAAWQASVGGAWDASGLLGAGLLLLMAYGVYKLFLADAHTPPPDQPQAPPPGFRPDYTGSSSSYPGTDGYHANPGFQNASAGYGFRSDYGGGQHYPGRRAAGGGGFWTGLGTGGLLGYLFGSQGQRHQPYTHFHSNSSYGPSYGMPRPSAPSHPTTSTGTRTASGFGGTKRR